MKYLAFSSRWAPRGLKRICCFLTIRLAMTWWRARPVSWK